MKKNILQLLKFHGIACFVSTVLLISTLVIMGVYAVLNNVSISLPRQIISIVFLGNNDDFSIELSFAENFIYQFFLFTVCLAVFLFSISKVIHLKKYNYMLLCLGIIVVQIIGFRLLLPKVTPLINIKMDQIKSIESNKQDGIIYIGRESCPECIIYEPSLKTFLNKVQLSVYYFNTTGNKKEVEEFRKFYNQLGAKSVPSVVFIKKGKIQNVLYGNKDDSKIEDKIKKSNLLIENINQ